MRKALILINLILAGCTVGPRYHPPKPTLPCEWHSAPAAGMNTSSPDNFLWWHCLNDPILNSLIYRAARSNPDVYIAALRILEARQEKKGKAADLLPRLDASAAYGNVYFSKDALVNGILSSLTPAEKRGIKRNVNFFEIGFDAEWEIDLFGVTSHQICALKAKIQASEETLCDIWITLSAEVARNYIELRGMQQRLRLTCSNIESQKDTVNLTRDLIKIGVASSIDLREAQEQLGILCAQEPLIRLAIDKTIHRLSILLGYSPGVLFAELSAPCGLPAIPENKPIGVPSELLRRRPDIRRAERDLAAATEMVGSAVASLFPRLSLNGFFGDISTNFKNILNPASTTWFIGPLLLAPIFNSRLIEQDIYFNKIKTREACYEYQKTVLDALEETENAIASYRYDVERNSCLAYAQWTSEEAYKLTEDLYQKGLKDYLEVLVTYRSFLDTQDQYIQSQMELLYDYIALYKALGGGWSCCTPCVDKGPSTPRTRNSNSDFRPCR